MDLEKLKELQLKQLQKHKAPKYMYRKKPSYLAPSEFVTIPKHEQRYSSEPEKPQPKPVP